MEMKKYTLLVLAALFLGPWAQAQTGLPNMNFENWEIGSNSRDSLSGWSSSNAVAMYPVNALVKDSTPAFQGNYSAKLITAPFGFVQYSKVSILVNGQATFTWNGGNGYSVDLVEGGGTPIDFKPLALNGYYKCVAASFNNQGLARVFLTRYDSTLQKRDTVSSGSLDFTPVTAYTAFSVPLTDLMPGVMPDTIITIFYSSNPATVSSNGAWTDLYLDSLTLEVPPTPPVANFGADSVVGTTNTVVHLADSSTNTPTAWQWTITPNTFSFQNGTTDTSQNPEVKFDTAGDYTVKLVVTNDDGSDSLTRTDYIRISEAPNGIGLVSLFKEITVYPNPVRNVLRLKGNYQGMSYQIVDLTGRQLQSGRHIDGRGIDVRALASGTYFLILTKDGPSKAFKFTATE